MENHAPKNQRSSTVAIVLAGGLSQRMGQDKALLMVESKPLIARTCQVAAEVCDSVAVVTPWVERYQPVLPGQVQLIQEPLFKADRSAGPLSGFMHGLQQQSADWILLLACDLPNLEGQILRHWAENLDRLPKAILAYVPRSSKGWEPLCGFYRQECINSLKEFLASEKRSFQHWLDTIPVQPIETYTDRILFNCNTPEDWSFFQFSS
jgi:molybdopterin-guanine dinucleotide biosynthesis protein A